MTKAKKEEPVTSEIQTIASGDVGTIEDVLGIATDTRKKTPTADAQARDAASETQTPEKGKLLSLSVLADRHRVVSWRQAALLRYMGWEDDKMVSEADYKAALTALENRRIGGGRK